MRHLIIYSEEIETALKECKALARMAKSARSLPVDTSLLPSLVPIRETADELIQLYFRTYESTYRILHVQSFLGEYAKYWENPLAASPLFVAKLLLVMTIGTCFHKDESIRALISHWLQAVQSFMSGPNEKGRLNTSGIQINCLLLLAKQSSFSGDDLNWISAGSLLRMAMNLGFHRDPKYFPKMTFFQAELRRRLWWSILELCVQYALDSGMPPLISFDDFDTNIPLNINDNEYDENTKEIPAVAPEGVSTHMSIQLVLIRSLKTRLSITSLLNGFKNFLTYEQCLELGSTLTAELRSQNLVLNGFRASASSICVPTNFHKSLVDVITRRFLLALHLPWTMLATPDPRYYFSRKVSLDTVLTLCSYTKNSVQPALAIEDEDEYYTLLKSRGGGVFRMVMVLGAMTICLECYKQIQEESPLSRDLLHTTLGELVDLAKQRVEYGETNVQGYLWLSVAKAHIDALETGQPIKEVAQATASKTMEYAQEMLKRQTSRVSGAATPMEDTASGDDFSWEFLIQSQNYTESIFDTPKSWWFSEWGNADIGTI
ncbi:hypothetical protein PVAG01_01320 [Phlyctema vagabunda]|uniref:Xylanolytic transcriptional activator regulatory domain-containing protein n=1 Tax=Phlyctema vagabunda TaxID=108571 RepID=A0ABR4PX50_9HELO